VKFVFWPAFSSELLLVGGLSPSFMGMERRDSDAVKVKLIIGVCYVMCKRGCGDESIVRDIAANCYELRCTFSFYLGNSDRCLHCWLIAVMFVLSVCKYRDYCYNDCERYVCWVS